MAKKKAPRTSITASARTIKLLSEYRQALVIEDLDLCGQGADLDAIFSLSLDGLVQSAVAGAMARIVDKKLARAAANSNKPPTEAETAQAAILTKLPAPVWSDWVPGDTDTVEKTDHLE